MPDQKTPNRVITAPLNFRIAKASPSALRLPLMSSQTSQRADEGFQASRCRAGDPQALAELREENHGPLLRILLSRGASPTEAEDLLADLWADCVPGDL